MHEFIQVIPGPGTKDRGLRTRDMDILEKATQGNENSKNKNQSQNASSVWPTACEMSNFNHTDKLENFV